MPGLLASDMTREGLLPVFQRASQTPLLDRATVTYFIDGAEAIAGFLDGWRQDVVALLDRGCERRRLAASVAELSRWIADASRAYEKVLVDAKSHGFPPADIATLTKIVEALGRMRTATDAQLDWLRTPLPPIDPAVVPARRDGASRGDYVGLDEFAANLRARNAE